MAPAPQLPEMLVVGLIFYWLTSVFKAASRRVRFTPRSRWIGVGLVLSAIVIGDCVWSQLSTREFSETIMAIGIGMSVGGAQPALPALTATKPRTPSIFLFLGCVIAGPTISLLFAWLDDCSSNLMAVDRPDLYATYLGIGLVAGVMTGIALFLSQGFTSSRSTRIDH